MPRKQQVSSSPKEAISLDTYVTTIPIMDNFAQKLGEEERFFFAMSLGQQYHTKSHLAALAQAAHELVQQKKYIEFVIFDYTHRHNLEAEIQENFPSADRATVNKLVSERLAEMKKPIYDDFEKIKNLYKEKYGKELLPKVPIYSCEDIVKDSEYGTYLEQAQNLINNDLFLQLEITEDAIRRSEQKGYSRPKAIEAIKRGKELYIASITNESEDKIKIIETIKTEIQKAIELASTKGAPTKQSLAFLTEELAICFHLYKKRRLHSLIYPRPPNATNTALSLIKRAYPSTPFPNYITAITTFNTSKKSIFSDSNHTLWQSSTPQDIPTNKNKLNKQKKVKRVSSDEVLPLSGENNDLTSPKSSSLPKDTFTGETIKFNNKDEPTSAQNTYLSARKKRSQKRRKENEEKNALNKESVISTDAKSEKTQTTIQPPESKPKPVNTFLDTSGQILLSMTGFILQELQYFQESKIKGNNTFKKGFFEDLATLFPNSQLQYKEISAYLKANSSSKLEAKKAAAIEEHSHLNTSSMDNHYEKVLHTLLKIMCNIYFAKDGAKEAQQQDMLEKIFRLAITTGFITSPDDKTSSLEDDVSNNINYDLSNQCTF